MFHFTAICRQTESRTLHGAYFSTINFFASCKFILLLSFKNEVVIYLTWSNCSKNFGNRTIERSVLLSLVIDHDNRRVSDFAWFLGTKLNLFYLFDMEILNFYLCLPCIRLKVMEWCEWIADIVEGFQIEVVCKKIK